MDKEIGKRVRIVRTSNKLSQEKMAEELGIRSTTHYQNIEYGKSRLSIEHLKILHEKFHVSPNFIILGEVCNEKDYLYNFFECSPAEQMKIYLDISKKIFGTSENDFEITIKDSVNVLRG